MAEMAAIPKGGVEGEEKDFSLDPGGLSRKKFFIGGVFLPLEKSAIPAIYAIQGDSEYERFMLDAQAACKSERSITAVAEHQ